jgi:hypothetical protein
MLKTALIAAVLAAGATAASAQDYRAQAPYGSNGGYGGYPSSDGGLGRYCPPGYYPHSFPSGNGIRCEPPGDTTTYIPGQ